MSLLYRNNQGDETHIAGLNGVSGELVPSVSLHQSGTFTNPEISGNNHAEVNITLSTPMPDADYVVDISIASSTNAYNVSFYIRDKTATGFTVNLMRDVEGTLPANAITFNYVAFKLMTDETTQLDEAQIALNKQDITTIKGKIPSTASSTEKLAYVEYNPSTSLYSTWAELLELLHQKGAGYWTGTIYIGKWYTYTARIVLGSSEYWYGTFLAKGAETEDLIGASKIYGAANTWIVTHYVTESDLPIKKMDISATGGATSFSATIPLSMAQRNKPFYLEVLSVGDNNTIKELKYLVFVSSMNTSVTTKEISKDSTFTNVSITFNESIGYELSFSSTDFLYSTTVYIQQ